MKKEEIELGMVFTFADHPEIEYVVIGIYPDNVSLERITQRSEGSNRHGCGYGWFTYESTSYIRKMGNKELNRYQTRDPLCSLEKGIYRTKKDIVNIDFKTLAEDGEVISISGVECEKSSCDNNYCLEITFRRFGFAEDFTATFYQKSKMESIHLFWNIFKKVNINA